MKTLLKNKKILVILLVNIILVFVSLFLIVDKRNTKKKQDEQKLNSEIIEANITSLNDVVIKTKVKESFNDDNYMIIWVLNDDRGEFLPLSNVLKLNQGQTDYEFIIPNDNYEQFIKTSNFTAIIKLENSNRSISSQEFQVNL